MNLGEIIFSDLHCNDYLIELYEELLSEYSKFLIGKQCFLSEKSIKDLLRFADLFSKSTNIECNEWHQNIAQEIVSLLFALYPDNQTVRYITGSVLSNINNLRGLQICVPEYKETGILDRIYYNTVKEFLKIPSENDIYYFKSQKEVISNFKNKYYSYSGPTSMGKSFIMRTFIKENIQKNKKDNYAIIVPTKALINEVSKKLISDLKMLLQSKNYKVITSPGTLSLKKRYNFILVFTPERLSYLLLEDPNFKIDYLFIDEAQKISSKDARSPLYYKLISMITSRAQETKIFFSSPNIPNPNIYLKLIDDYEDDSSMSKSYQYTPVNQIKFLLNFKTTKSYIYNSLNNEFIDNSDFFDLENINFSKLIYYIGKNKQNIVYCGSTRKAVKLAVEYADTLEKKIENSKLDDLIKVISNDIHSDYYLLDVLSKGVAYHIGYLPANIREEMESLYREGIIKTMFCTSTLIEGVNLPADNLFVTSYKNGRPEFGEIEFKNLIGRVGRIEYNLYGNVFLVILPTEELSQDKFKDLIVKEVGDQSLSVSANLKPKYKKYIIQQLKQGNISLSKLDNQSYNDYKVMRKFSLVLLNDILNNKKSYIVEEFRKYMSEADEIEIRNKFIENNYIDNDISVSPDQSKNLVEEINNGLTYPKSFDYNELMNFLNKLSDIFKWKQYEKDSIGRDNVLRWYAVILNQWVQGYGLGQIIDKAIKYKQDNPKIYIDFTEVKYDDSKEHRNYVISDTLDAIEQIILFQFSNYFMKFSSTYKKVFNIKSIENDWYEFVEYGTNNKLSIFLQKHELSRETALYIRRNPVFYIESENIIKLKQDILDCGNKSVSAELKIIKLNMPELFILNENDLIDILNNSDTIINNLHSVIDRYLSNLSIEFPKLSIYGWGELEYIKINDIEIYKMENSIDRYTGYIEVECDISYVIVAKNPIYEKDEPSYVEYLYDYGHELDLCVGMDFEYLAEKQEFIFENEEIV